MASFVAVSRVLPTWCTPQPRLARERLGAGVIVASLCYEGWPDAMEWESRLSIAACLARVRVMRVAFGVGRLHHVISARGREEIILGAIDAGCSHFDVAPCYGDGLNESELGRILKGRRAQVTIATKFGIDFDSIGELPTGQYLARKAIARSFSRRYRAFYVERVFSPDFVVSQLEGSLRRLRTDYVDYFFAHEPRSISDMRAVAELLPVLKEQQRLGKVRLLGVAGSAALLRSSEEGGLGLGQVVMAPLVLEDVELLRNWAGEREVFLYGLMRFMRESGTKDRLNVAALLKLVTLAIPSGVPMVASNSIEQIRRLAKALQDLRVCDASARDDSGHVGGGDA